VLRGNGRRGREVSRVREGWRMCRARAREAPIAPGLRKAMVLIDMVG